MNDLAPTYRLRALASEHRAIVTSDSNVKKEWEELAMQWHFMSNAAAVDADRRPLKSGKRIVAGFHKDVGNCP
jgi:hypothetical protein